MATIESTQSTLAETQQLELQPELVREEIAIAETQTAVMAAVPKQESVSVKQMRSTVQVQEQKAEVSTETVHVGEMALPAGEIITGQEVQKQEMTITTMKTRHEMKAMVQEAQFEVEKPRDVTELATEQVTPGEITMVLDTAGVLMPQTVQVGIQEEKLTTEIISEGLQAVTSETAVTAETTREVSVAEVKMPKGFKVHEQQAIVSAEATQDAEFSTTQEMVAPEQITTKVVNA